MDALQLGNNTEEALVKALQFTTGFLIAQRTAIHFQKMTGCLQRLTDAGEIGARDIFGECKRRQTMRMGCILTGPMEFALQVLLGNQRVAQMRCSTFEVLSAVGRYVELLL